MPSPSLDTAQLVYLYDGTLEGMLTGVFEAFARKEFPVAIVREGNLQQSLLCSYIPIATDVALAERVQQGIVKKLGDRSYENVKRVFLSDVDEKGGVILRYLLYTMKQGRRGCAHLANPAVNAFEELLRQVDKEAHYMLQFVRFAQLDNGVFFSRIEPKASVVPLIMGHFAARFNIQPFMIYDACHGLSGVFDTEKWWLVDARDIEVPDRSRAEDEFQSLWQTFYDTIAIEERRNPTCQRNFMPKRFWGNMCEQIPPQLRNLRPSTQTPTTVAKRQAGLPEARRVLLPAAR
jgi:probable DNA metabolism protein